MRTESNRIRGLFIIGVLFITGCSTPAYVVLEDDNFYFNEDHCNRQKELSQSTQKSLFKSGVFTAKDDLLHLQVVFQGKRKGYICMLNCNAGFQGPRYLSFYDGSQMTVVTNRFDLEVLYRQFESFRKECGLEKPKEVWKYILEFTDTELFNEHNRINF